MRRIKDQKNCDSHQKSSQEFITYPPHCLKGSEESEIIEELKIIGGYQLIEKNSTNGFLEPDFQVY